jgi:hypothetical protein
MAASSSPKKASSALAGAQLLLRRVKLGGCQFLGSSFVRYYSLLNLLIITSDAINLPGTNDAIVQRVDYVKDVATAKAHFPFVRMLVMEMRSTIEPGINGYLQTYFRNLAQMRCLLYVEGVALPRSYNLLVLLSAMLNN